MAVFRIIRTLNAKTVFRAGRDAADIDVPDVTVAFQQRDARAFLAAIVGEQTQVNRLGVFGKDGKVYTQPVKSGTQRIGSTRSKRVFTQFRRDTVVQVHIHAVRDSYSWA